MRKFIILLPILLIIIIFFLLSGTIEKKDTFLMYKALKIVLNQDNNSELLVKDISIIDTYPIRYDNNLRDNYINIEIVDEENNVLFHGKEMTKDYLIVDQLSPEATGGSGIYNKNNIVLLLPYYPLSSTVLIKDTGNITKLNIKLKDFKLEVGKEINMCGNGICDKGENFLSCWRDCQVQLTEFFKKVAP